MLVVVVVNVLLCITLRPTTTTLYVGMPTSQRAPRSHNNRGSYCFTLPMLATIIAVVKGLNRKKRSSEIPLSPASRVPAALGDSSSLTFTTALESGKGK